MMQPRNSTYSFYCGHELELIKLTDGSFNLVSRNNLRPDFSFTLYPNGESIYVKNISAIELSNAYTVETHAYFKNIEWHADLIKNGKIRLWVETKPDVENVEMIERGRYELWADLSQIEKLWETRGPSAFSNNFPNEIGTSQIISEDNP